MSQRPIVLFGGTGKVGYELLPILSAFRPVLAPPRSDLDLSRLDDVAAYLRVSRPSLIVNAAAMTDIDGAEDSIIEMQQINWQLPEFLAGEALERAIGLVQFSTDMVFDGRGRKHPYVEEDMPNPLNAFGRAMLRAESAIRSIAPLHMILRTSGVFSLRRNCFLKKLLKILEQHSDINVASDQFVGPTWARTIAETAGHIITSGGIIDGADGARKESGLYHISSAGEASWYTFSKIVVEVLDNRQSVWPKGKRPTLRAVDADMVPTRARRPRYSVLSSEKAKSTFGVSTTHWAEQLKACLAEL